MQSAVSVKYSVLALSTLDETPINSDQIEKWTSADPVLSQVRRFVEQGWSEQTPPEFDCYRHRKDELSVQQGVLFWGTRVIIPPKGRGALLRELHDTHPGIVKMKALARSYIRVTCFILRREECYILVR